MSMPTRTLAAVAAGTVLAGSAFAQSAREVRGASPFVAIENEPAPKLVADPPLPDQLSRGIVQVNAEHHVFTACATCGQTVTFTVPGPASN